MKKIISTIVVGLASMSVQAQSGYVSGSVSGGATGSGSVQAGCTMPNPPSVGDCWDCFQDLLEDCDSNNPEGTRRQACYEAANNFFTWCLGNVGGPRDGRSSLNFDMNANKEFDLRSGISYEMFVPAGTDPEDIAISVRYFNGSDEKNVRLDTTEFFVFNQTGVDDLFLIVIDTDLSIGNSNSVGIVTSIEENNSVEYGFAFAADVTDSFDIDGDGDFDHFDRVQAMTEYAKGNLDHAMLTRILNAAE